MQKRLFLTTILLSFLLLPVGAAASGSITATKLTLDDSTVEGDLAAVALLRVRDEHLPPAFSLTAASGSMHVDHSDHAVPAANTHLNSEPRHSDHTNLQVDGARNGGEAVLFVHPAYAGAATVRFTSTCMELAPSDIGEESRPHRLDPRQGTHRADLSRSARAHLCGTTDTLTIEGSFLLGLWDWESSWNSDQGSGRLATGPQEGNGPFATADEAFLQVQGGTLVLPVNDPSVRLFLGRSQASAPMAHLDNVQGDLPTDDSTTLDGTRATLRDALLDLHPTGVNRPIQVTLREQGDAPAPLTAVAVRIPGSAPYLAAALALVVGALVVLHRIHRRPERALSILWSDHEADLRLAPRTRRERRALGMQLLGAHHALEGRRRHSQRLQARAARLYDEPVESLLGLGESLLALGAYEHALDAFFVVQESGPTATQQVRAQVGAAVAHLRRGGELDRHVCAEYLQDARSRDPGTVRRLLSRAGELGTELEGIDRSTHDPTTAMFG